MGYVPTESLFKNFGSVCSNSSIFTLFCKRVSFKFSKLTYILSYLLRILDVQKTVNIFLSNSNMKFSSNVCRYRIIYFLDVSA